MIFVEIAVVLLLIVVNGLLAMSELAVISARRSKLQSLVAEGSRGAQMALRLMDDPTRFLSTAQIGITLVGVLAGAFSGATLADRLGDWLDTWQIIAPHGDSIAIGIVVVAITYVSLIAGELVPKRIAWRSPEAVASAVAPAMQRLARIASPAVWLLKVSTEAAISALRLAVVRETTVTEDEVRMLIAEGTRAGVFMPREREMIEGVLKLADRKVRAIMTPRTEVVWLEERATAQEIAEQLTRRHLSRFPVCHETIDYPVGIVHTKDLVGVLLRGEPIVLTDCMVRPLLVPEGVSVLKVLDAFRSEGARTAIVVDEYGATEGIVTLADILEAIAGELPEPGEGSEPTLVLRSDGSWLVDGSLRIDKFADRVGLRGLRRLGDFDTVAGLVLHQLGRLPTVGDSVVARGGRFEVVDMDGRRIDKILYVPASKPPANARL